MNFIDVCKQVIDYVSNNDTITSLVILVSPILFIYIIKLLYFIFDFIKNLRYAKRLHTNPADSKDECVRINPKVDGKSSEHTDSVPQSAQTCINCLHPEFFDALQRHKVKYLVHFTKACNLQNIFTFGLCSRDVLYRTNVTYSASDPDRFDQNYDAICTSIEFPNYLMFYKKRMETKNVDWVVLIIDATILTQRNARFYLGNASRNDYAVTRISDLRDFDNLFLDNTYRAYCNLPSWYATDPQSEVQIIDHIPANYIKAVAFDNAFIMNQYRSYLPDYVRAECDEFYFGPRRDYKLYNHSSAFPFTSYTSANCRVTKEKEVESFEDESPCCENCMVRRAGDCTELFPTPCKDYRKIPYISQAERDSWPEFGDATYYRLNKNLK